ncbi:hypothetical protein BGX28_006695 [Mortierella sp. GBA30]|nr:hypothetical protein BGX28_006695 [Mortierella sp. GBA30]
MIAGDTTSKIPGIISLIVYGILGISGLLSVIFKTFTLAKNFSVCWWSVTIVASLLSLVNVILLATKSKNDIKEHCATGPSNERVDWNGDIDSCYRFVMLVAGLSLAIEVIVMSLCGVVASRYTRQVKHQNDGPDYGQIPPPKSSNNADVGLRAL